MKMDLRRKTKMVCTLGPATESRRTVEQLVRAGMNVARVNLSHGDESQHHRLITTVRAAAERLQVPVAILLDLPGPRYRTGGLESGQVSLKKGSRFVLTSRDVPGDDREVSLNLPGLSQKVKAGDTILLADGAFRLRVRDVTDTDVICSVLVGGVLKPRRGIAVPGVRLQEAYITEQMQRQLEFAVEREVDYIALSYVSRASDVSAVRAIHDSLAGGAALIAKVERPEAVRSFKSVLRASDGVMVARGDLGVELPLEKVPLVQKDLIRKCNRAGKPVITATQMLESMTNASRPTRAEVTDVANAIWDGTDAVMLSAETSVGSYPVEAASMMTRIARQTEAAFPYGRASQENDDGLEPQMDDAIAYSACHTAHQVGAKAIIAFTESGSTVWRVCKYRPKVPILAITPYLAVVRRLALAWGVLPFQVPSPKHVDDLFAEGVAVARSVGAATRGDRVVITGGIPIGVPGTTNLLKVHEV